MGRNLDKCSVLERIKQRYSLSSNAELSRFLGVAPNTISNWYNRKTFDIDIIFTKCEDTNLEWLLTGHGPMLKHPADHPSVPEKQPGMTVSEPIEPRSNAVQTPIRKETRQQKADPSPDVILSLLETIRQQAEEIGMLKERMRAVEEERAKLAEAAQSSDVANAG